MKLKLFSTISSQAYTFQNINQLTFSPTTNTIVYAINSLGAYYDTISGIRSLQQSYFNALRSIGFVFSDNYRKIQKQICRL